MTKLEQSTRRKPACTIDEIGAEGSERMRRNEKRVLVHIFISLCVGFAMISCGGSEDTVGDEVQPPSYPSSYPNAKIIFVTSEVGDGNLIGWMSECSGRSTGLEAADCICQAYAKRGKLSGTYKAWLSDATTSASSRLSHSGLQYVNRRGKLIAANWSELANGARPCDSIMNYDENGEIRQLPYQLVWTGTDGFGNIHSLLKYCDNWTSGVSSAGGMCGITIVPTNGNLDACWTQWGWRPCDDLNGLICVEQ